MKKGKKIAFFNIKCSIIYLLIKNLAVIIYLELFMNSWKLYKPKEAITERPDEEENVTDRENSFDNQKDITKKTKLDQMLEFRKDKKDSYEFLTKANKSSTISNITSNTKKQMSTADSYKPYDKNVVDDEFKDVDLQFDLKNNKEYEGIEKVNYIIITISGSK
jgi:hypothetical protein